MLDEKLRGTNMIVVDTFDYNSHVFDFIWRKNQCFLKSEYDSRLITRLLIKPDLFIYFYEGGYQHGVSLLKPIFPNVPKVLAMDFNIDPNIFEVLVHYQLISYSKAMADLYDFDPKYSRDYFYHTRDYKHAKNKDLVLSKLRNGIFN